MTIYVLIYINNFLLRGQVKQVDCIFRASTKFMTRHRMEDKCKTTEISVKCS